MSQEQPGQKPSSNLVITLEDVAKTAAAPPAYGAASAAAPPGVEAAPRKPESPPAGFWLRLAAKLIDLALILAVIFLVFVVKALLRSLTPREVWQIVQQSWVHILLYKALPMFIVTYFIYTIFTHAADGRSIGKGICGIRVVTPEGNFYRPCYFFGRFLAAGFSLLFLCIGHIMAGFRADKRALHDIVVGSRVVKG